MENEHRLPTTDQILTRARSRYRIMRKERLLYIYRRRQVDRLRNVAAFELVGEATVDDEVSTDLVGETSAEEIVELRE